MNEVGGELTPGARVGEYEIVRLLGRGGMGAVYLANDVDSRRQVALKTLSLALAQDPGYLERFESEAQAMARVSHPNIVTLYKLHPRYRPPLIAMEYVEGETLAAVLARGPLSPKRTGSLAQDICAAFSACHEAGVIHRDIKPPNIMLSRGFNGITPRVMDFGIAKTLGAPNLTGSGAIVGTQLYLSPEQVTGRDVTYRSDIFQLGVIFYECVTGRPPHVGKSIHEYITDLVSGRFALPTEINPEIPPAFEVVILKALHVDPARRYASARELGEALLPFAPPTTQRTWSSYYTRQGMDPDLELSRPGWQHAPSQQALQPRGVTPIATSDRHRQSSGVPMAVGGGSSASAPAVSTIGPAAAGSRRRRRSPAVAIAAGVGFGAAVVAAFGLLGADRWLTAIVRPSGPALAPPERLSSATAASIPSPAPATSTERARESVATAPAQPSPGAAAAAPGQDPPAHPGLKAEVATPTERSRRRAAARTEANHLVSEAETAFQEARMADSIRLAKEALDLGAGAAARLVLAKSYLHLELYREAREQYAAILERAPRDPLAIRGLRIANERLGRGP